MVASARGSNGASAALRSVMGALSVIELGRGRGYRTAGRIGQ
jgi:hypothetical protein